MAAKVADNLVKIDATGVYATDAGKSYLGVPGYATMPDTALTVTSKEVSGGMAYFDVGSTVAAAVEAAWKRGYWATIALSPPDANYDGTLRYYGRTGDRIYFERAGGGGTQALTACGGTITLSRQTPQVGYVPAKYGTANMLAGTFVQWDTVTGGTSENDDTGLQLADAYIRASGTTRTALHVGRCTTGVDDGYSVIFGKRSISAWQWLNDGHTVRRYSNGGNSHFDNSYTALRQGFYTVGYKSRAGYANGGAYLAANLTLAGDALGYGMLSDGVFSVAGGTTGNDLNTALPAGVAVVPRTPSAIASGSTNNYSPGVGLFQWWTANGAGSTLTGMAAGVTGEARLVHVLGGTLTVNNEDAASTAANRFTCNTGANIAAAAGSLLLFVYRPATSRWYVTQLA